MTIGYGLGILLVGMIEITIGAAITLYIINKYVVNKENNE